MRTITGAFRNWIMVCEKDVRIYQNLDFYLAQIEAIKISQVTWKPVYISQQYNVEMNGLSGLDEIYEPMGYAYRGAFYFPEAFDIIQKEQEDRIKYYEKELDYYKDINSSLEKENMDLKTSLEVNQVKTETVILSDIVNLLNSNPVIQSSGKKRGRPKRAVVNV